MKHTTFDELKPIADVVALPTGSRDDIRRDRLERFASLLEAHRDPICLFNQLEYISRSALRLLRSDSSPLAIAFADPVLRSQGLRSDSYGDAVEFFDLTSREAHHLLCDCHYSSRHVSSEMIASRVRSLASQLSLRARLEMLRQKLVHGFSLRLQS